MTTRRSLAALCAVLLVTLALPGAAFAHAQLEGTSPERGATLDSAPTEVVFEFSEPVEGEFGAIKVFGPGGDRVDNEKLVRADGGRTISSRVDATEDGTYTATYRVISADSHPISGGFVFNVGKSTGSGDVSKLIADQDRNDPVVSGAYSVAKFISYAALAIVFGGIFFLKFLFLPAVTRCGSGATRTIAPARERADLLLGVGIAAGLLASVAELVLFASTVSGESVLSAIQAHTLSAVLETRSGFWMAVRIAVWTAIAIVWFAFARKPRAHGGSAVLLVLLAVAAQTPALIGHAGATEPRILMGAADFVHVAAASIWVGGLVFAFSVLPRATAAVSPRRRTRLLVEVFARFSPVALACVALIVVSGVFQTIVHLDDLSELWSAAFGRAILVKVALLLVLAALGAWNRFSVIPQLRRQVAQEDPPGDAGVTLKRTLSAELVLSFAVLVAAALLVGYSPASAATGPFSTTTTVGPLDLQLTVDPAATGANEVHMYLFDPETGAPFTGTKEISASIALEDAELGPIALELERAGPGHYLAPLATFAKSGDWDLDLVVRVSEFDQYEKAIEVPVR